VVKIINFRNYNKVCRTVDPPQQPRPGALLRNRSTGRPVWLARDIVPPLQTPFGGWRYNPIRIGRMSTGGKTTSIAGRAPTG
jgi:hypothetical protein